MPNLKHRRWWLAVGWSLVALVTVLSLMPQPPQPLDFDSSDKLEHMSAYALLMAWFCQMYWTGRHRFRLGLALVCMGVTVEIVQGMTGYRTFDTADMLANGAGVLAGWALSQTGMQHWLAALDQRIGVPLKS